MSEKPLNLSKIQESFSTQAEDFEKFNMNFSKQDFLDFTVESMELNKNDNVLETAAGTCACGRSIAPFVNWVTCLDATKAMLDVGKREAQKSNLNNMTFIEGFVEDLPFPDESFDIVVSRLAFHHFVEIEKPFFEMKRVLKKGGKLVIIDMEAAPEELREIEDHIETMRDFSHVKNISNTEILDLYKRNGLEVTKNQTTNISVILEAWLSLTKTPEDISKEITKMMQDEIKGGKKTGFTPFLEDNEIHFWQRWMLVIGKK